MTKYRIKAYFMHEHEQAAAQTAVDSSVIADAEWTQAYVMGVVDKSKIKSLTKQGLVVSVVEEIASGAEKATPDLFAINAPLASSAGVQTKRPLPMVNESQTDADKVLSRDRQQTQFYIVRFHGSLTDERQAELRKLGIKLNERLTRNKYTVQLKPSQVNILAGVPFVHWLRLYTTEDTLRVQETPPVQKPVPKISGTKSGKRSKAKTPSAVEPTQRTFVYTVRVHQKKDLTAIVKWLARRNRKPLWKRDDQLQVALKANSKTLTDLAKRPEVALIEQFEAPSVYDAPARTLLGLVRDNISLGLEGAGEIIGVADTGIDKSHADLKKRIAGLSAWGRPGDTSDPEGHGTHVAGCMVGDGTASHGEVMGAAPQAKLFFQSILDQNGTLGGLPNDIGDLLEEAYDKGARIHNNSWGAFSFARYSSMSLDVDRFVFEHPDMLVVIAAGNDAIGMARAPGSRMNSPKGFVDWPCVAGPATAKNGLTVGASRSSRTSGGYAKLTWKDAWPDRYPDAPIARQRISSDDQSLAAFSSRGPSDDSRIKPDVVAPGTDIAAAKSKDAPLYKFWGPYPHNDQYGFMGGTSMAAPYVAGCAALVREWYRKKGNWATPSAALLKATLINGTQRMTGADAIAALAGDPNFHQGFGRINMSNTVPSPLSPKLKLAFEDTWKDRGRQLSRKKASFLYRIQVDKKLPLRVCLAWTDPGARALQNSLVLLVDNPSHKKWLGNEQAATLLNIAGGPRDPNNNVQIVRIEQPEPGDHTIAISVGNLLLPPQAFALVVTGDLQSELIPLN